MRERSTAQSITAILRIYRTPDPKLTTIDLSVKLTYYDLMVTPVFNSYILKTRMPNIYDVSVPDIFGDQVFEILGAHNVLEALHTCCEISLGTEEFHLQIFGNPEVLEEIFIFSE